MSWDHFCHGMAKWWFCLPTLPSSCPLQDLREHSCPSVVPTSQPCMFIWSTREESLKRLLKRTGMETHGPFYFGVKASGGWETITAGAVMPSVAKRILSHWMSELGLFGIQGQGCCLSKSFLQNRYAVHSCQEKNTNVTFQSFSLL